MSYFAQTLQISQQKKTTLTFQWLIQIIYGLIKPRPRYSKSRQFQDMSEHMLRDIGLTRADIESLAEDCLATRRLENLKREPGKGSKF